MNELIELRQRLIRDLADSEVESPGGRGGQVSPPADGDGSPLKGFIDRYERESDSYRVVSRLLSWSWALSGWSRDPGPTLRCCCTAATYLNREGKTLIRRTAIP